MRTKRKLTVGLVVAVVGLAIGAGLALATGGGDDERLRGSTYERATAAALEHAGGGEVLETETGDDGAVYEVEIRRSDGSEIEVQLDQNFEVLGSESDDDGPNDVEEPGDDD